MNEQFNHTSWVNAHRMNGVISGSISIGSTYQTFVFIVKFKCYNNRSTKGAVDVLPLHSWGLLVSGPSYSYSPWSTWLTNLDVKCFISRNWSYQVGEVQLVCYAEFLIGVTLQKQKHNRRKPLPKEKAWSVKRVVNSADLPWTMDFRSYKNGTITAL